jgi:hypothetical protein
MATLTAAKKMPRPEHGLCTTCSQVETCVFPKNPGRPFLECEEFEGLTMKPQKASGPESGWTVLGQDQLLGKRLGLCANCEGRATCVFPKPERGVLQCEEYR